MPKKCSFCGKQTVGIPTFQVTRKRIEKWANVIPRQLKIGDLICQSHCNKGEIGILASKNVRVKKATLMAGAISEVTDKSSPNESDDLASTQTLRVKQDKLNLRQYRNKYKKYKSPDHTDIENRTNLQNKLKKYKSPDHTDIKNRTNLQNCNKTTNSNSFFEQIISDPYLIRLPPGWCRIVSENNKNIVFCKVLLREENSLPYIERSVLLNNLNTINCTFIDLFINPTVFSMSLDTNLCANKLQNVINKMANVKMCLGVNIPLELQQFKPKSVFIDNFGKFRHYSCQIINNCVEITQCQFCRTLMGTVNRKKLRSKVKNTEKQIQSTAVSSSKIQKSKQSEYQEPIQIDSA